MSMEFKLNSVGGGDSRPLFRGEDEICEVLEPARGLDSASVTAGRLAEGALD